MISAKHLEEVMDDINSAYGLDLLNFCGYNGVGFIYNQITIVREEQLYADPTYSQWKEMSWWERYGRFVIFGVFIAALVLVAVVAVFTLETALGMYMAGLKAGLTSMAFTLVQQGIISAITGQNFFANLGDKLVQSFMISFAIAVVVTGISEGIKAIARTISANRVTPVSDTSGNAAIQSSAAKDTAVIGKVADLNNYELQPNEFKVADLLFDKGSPKANWGNNSGVLRKVMQEVSYIRDVSSFEGRLLNNTGFLAMERNLLQNHGWQFINGFGLPGGI